MSVYKNTFLVSLLLLVVFVTAFSTPAQKSSEKSIALAARTGSIQDEKLASKLMGRDMPYRVALPANYASGSQERFAVIYLLHGLGGHYDNWGSKTKIAEYLAPYPVIVVMPEGGDGWYTDSANQPNDHYETYITAELIPEIDKKFRTLADRQHRIIAGLSMGGYGSIKFGLKNPEMFGLVGSFSGALGAAGWNEKLLALAGIKSGAIPESIKSVYGADDSTTRRENDIFRMVKEISAEKIKSLPFIYLDCGTEDFLFQNNRDFLNLLNEKKIPHEFRELPGGHTWQYWEAQIQDFLRLSVRYFNQTKAKNA